MTSILEVALPMIATWEDFFLIKGRASKLKTVEAERNPVDL